MRILIMLNKEFLLVYFQTASKTSIKYFVVVDMDNAHFAGEDHNLCMDEVHNGIVKVTKVGALIVRHFAVDRVPTL